MIGLLRSCDKSWWSKLQAVLRLEPKSSEVSGSKPLGPVIIVAQLVWRWQQGNSYQLPVEVLPRTNSGAQPALVERGN